MERLTDVEMMIDTGIACVLPFGAGIGIGILIFTMLIDGICAETRKVVLWFCMNVVIIVVWVYLAVHFDKWWIALFSIISTYSYKVKKGDAE